MAAANLRRKIGPFKGRLETSVDSAEQFLKQEMKLDDSLYVNELKKHTVTLTTQLSAFNHVDEDLLKASEGNPEETKKIEERDESYVVVPQRAVEGIAHLSTILKDFNEMTKEKRELEEKLAKLQLETKLNEQKLVYTQELEKEKQAMNHQLDEIKQREAAQRGEYEHQRQMRQAEFESERQKFESERSSRDRTHESSTHSQVENISSKTLKLPKLDFVKLTKDSIFYLQSIDKFQKLFM